MNTPTLLAGCPRLLHQQSRARQSRPMPPLDRVSRQFHQGGRAGAKTHIKRFLPIALVKSVLLYGLLGSGLVGFIPALDAAQTRSWSGVGDGQHWSDSNNWIPRS